MTVVSATAVDHGRDGLDLAHSRRRLRGIKPSLWLSLVWVALLVIVALTAQWLPLHNPATPVGAANLNPNWGREFLGTDDVGRSMVSRMAFGARVSLEISVLATMLSLTVGAVLGLMAVYLGGVVRVVTNVLANTVFAIPGVLLLLALVVALRPTFPVIICSIALVYVPAFMRLTRANGLTQIVRDYIAAARSMGATGTRIMFREMLPNTLLSVVSYAVIVVPHAMILEGALSYLGFGVQPPTPSWGEMISLGQPLLTTSPWQAVMPCLFLAVSVLAFNTIGDELRVRFDVREAI